MQSIYRQTGEMPEELDIPDIPDMAGHVWSWFGELVTARQQGAPIPYTEIEAFSRLTNTPMEPWEVRALKALDIEYLKIVHSDD